MGWNWNGRTITRLLKPSHVNHSKHVTRVGTIMAPEAEEEILCNKLIRRNITIPGCRETNPDDCSRSYFLHLPSILCKQQNSSDAGDIPFDTLPLVFAIHCFGCPAMTMYNSFVQHTNEHNSVLVVPEGIKKSFNARYCCGYALENNVDDVGFISTIQSTLSEQYDFIHSRYTYATGWSNGGFMVMHASKLFRAIAPISGFIGDIDVAKMKRGDESSGKGLFIHHGKDDPFVRPTGCCHDPSLPKCCCNIAADTCTGVIDVAKNWAIQVNGCHNDEHLLLETSYADTDEGIQCLTATNCTANTTICLYDHSGHFNQMSFDTAFPMANEVMNFFAGEACEINNGKWDRISKTCSCHSKFSGTFCLDESAVSKMKKIDPYFSRFFVMMASLVMLVLASCVMMRKQRRRHGKRNGEYAKVEEDDIEM